MNNDGGPAYPTTDGAMFETQPDGNSIYRVAPGCNGMSLRDYFAAAALQGMLAHEGPILRIGWDDHDVAVTAYSLADAMLSTRAYVDS
jgi:hypothetical protein